MSQEVMGQSLNLIMLMENAENFSALTPRLAKLGHQIVAAIPVDEQVVEQCVAIREVPSLIITDVTNSDLLERVHNLFLERRVDVPLLGVYARPNPAMIDTTAHLYYFMGGYTSAALRGAQLDLAILFAVKKFRTIVEYAQEITRVSQALEDRKHIEKAKGMIMKVCQLEEDLAHRRLQDLASAHRISLAEQAKRVTESYKDFFLP